MTDEAALLKAVLHSPDDDAPRLIYADWLDEQGECDRAEFIRVQCRIAELELGCSCGRCARLRGGGQHTNGPCAADRDRQYRPFTLRRRERELLAGSWAGWCHEAFDALAHDVGVATEGRVLHVHLYDEARNQTGEFRCSFRRGFVEEVTCTWAWWAANLKAVLEAQPVRRVVLTTMPEPLRVPPRLLPNLAGTLRRAGWPGIELVMPSFPSVAWD